MRHAYVGTTETTADLDAYLDPDVGNPFFMVDLWDITLAGLGYPDPLHLRFCDMPFDVPFFDPFDAGGASAVYAGGFHFDSTGAPDPAPRIMRGGRKDVIGVEVDTLDLDFFLDGGELLPPADGDSGTPRLPLSEAILRQVFAGAEVKLRRLYMPAPPTYPFHSTSVWNRGDLGPGDTSLGAVVLFGGFVSDSKLTQTKASLTVKSGSEKMSVGYPVRIFQANCPFNVYDDHCGVSPTGSFGGNAFQASAAVANQAGTTNRTLLVTGSWPTDTPLSQPQNYWRFGTVRFTSGALAGLTRSVQTSGDFPPGDTTYLQLLSPLPRAPEPGDTCVVQKGCAKTQAACRDEFGNYVDSTTETITLNGVTHSGVHVNGLRFGGQSRVPPPDSAV